MPFPNYDNILPYIDVFRLKFNLENQLVNQSGISVLANLGRCYTFNDKGLYKSKRVGVLHGLEVTADIEQETYWTGNEGAGLTVGRQ